jgi:hypothetical protein
VNAWERSLGLVSRFALAGLVVAGTVLATIDPFTLLFFVSYAAVGALLVARRPANSIGWLTLIIAFGFLGTTARPDVDLEALRAGTASGRDFVLAWVGSWVGGALFVGFLALTIVFPSGRPPSGRWRGPAAALVATGIALLVLGAIAPTLSINPDGLTNLTFPNRLAILPSLPIWSLISTDSVTLATVALLALGVGALLVRYRGSTGMVRLQLRWLVSAVAFVIAAVLIGLGATALFGDAAGGLQWVPAIFAYPTVPIAIGIAVMRYRLLEIDRIVSRTIGWTLVTGVLLAIFVSIVVALQAALSSFTQGQTLAVATSTLIAFALFQPVRRRVQRTIDRRFDRTRYDGERVVAAFSERLRHELDLETLAGEVDRVATETVRPTKATVWLRPPSRTSPRQQIP